MSEHHAFHGRVEDRRLITGNGRYTADFNLAGQLHATFLRADRAHAEIRGIDTSAAGKHPGVIAVWTAADLAGRERVGTEEMGLALRLRELETLLTQQPAPV